MAVTGLIVVQWIGMANWIAAPRKIGNTSRTTCGHSIRGRSIQMTIHAHLAESALVQILHLNHARSVNAQHALLDVRLDISSAHEEGVGGIFMQGAQVEEMGDGFLATRGEVRIVRFQVLDAREQIWIGLLRTLQGSILALQGGDAIGLLALGFLEGFDLRAETHGDGQGGGPESSR